MHARPEQAGTDPADPAAGRSAGQTERHINNAAIAHELKTLAQLLAASGENPFKIKAYRRAAETIEGTSDSIAELVRTGGDLTALPGIGAGIAVAVREIVTSGQLRTIEKLRSTVSPEIAALSEFPRLDPKRVKQIYKQLGISSLAALREQLDAGAIGAALGPRVEQHVRQALIPSQEMLLYDADLVVERLVDYLRKRCGVACVEAAGDFRRRVEVIRELQLVVSTTDFGGVVRTLGKYGGHSEILSASHDRATVRLPMGLVVTIENTSEGTWGLALLVATGSEAHLAQLESSGRDPAKLAQTRGARWPTEASVYRKLKLQYIPPELRDGTDEVERAAKKALPTLVEISALRGDLHMHTTASDGANSIEEMAAAAKERGYDYIGIADHSQSLKIAGGLSEAELWRQIRRIDQLNQKLNGIRVLKSAEVDIRIDGTLDYPDALLREIDYTVCSIHSRFGMSKDQQTDRILRAMDNPFFSILGHATGRLLLRRPGYQIDIDRVVRHAAERGCYFEINSSPDRLDLSTEHARIACAARIPIAICTDAHSTSELDFVRCGIDVARRAGLERSDVLNTLPTERLLRALRRRRA